MFKFFKKMLKEKKLDPDPKYMGHIKTFESVLFNANALSFIPSGVFKYINTLTKCINYNYAMSYHMDDKYKQHTTKFDSYSELFFNLNDVAISYEENNIKSINLIKSTNLDMTFHIPTSPIIETPFNCSRVGACNAILGSNMKVEHINFMLAGLDYKPNNWQQDPNHQISLLMPFRILLVKSGNHSLFTGMLLEDAILTDNFKVYDFTELLSHTYTDGVFYYSKNNNRKIAKVTVPELAVIYKIGEFLAKNQNYSPYFSEINYIYKKR